MKQSGRSFIPLFTLIKLLLRLAAFTCLSLLSPWRSLHPLSPRQHKLRDLESGIGWQEEESDSEIGKNGQTISLRERERDRAKELQKKKKKHERREQKSAKGINSKMKKNSLDVSERTEVK